MVANREMGPGELCGLLVEEAPDRTLHDYIAEYVRTHGWWRGPFIIRNDPRMKAALLLLGYEVVARVRVGGIERFARA